MHSRPGGKRTRRVEVGASRFSFGKCDRSTAGRRRRLEYLGRQLAHGKGRTLVEYYAPDGTAKSMLGNEISTGKWALVGETICFQYSDQNEMECYKLEVMGNTATFTDQKGTGTRYEILKGNPKGL